MYALLNNFLLISNLKELKWCGDFDHNTLEVTGLCIFDYSNSRCTRNRAEIKLLEISQMVNEWMIIDFCLLLSFPLERLER